VTFEDFLKIGFAVDVKVNEGGEEAKEGEGSLPYDDVKYQKVMKLVTPATKKSHRICRRQSRVQIVLKNTERLSGPERRC